MMQRIVYLLLVLLLIAAALFTRTGFPMPSWISVYAGDYLWGVMLYFLLCTILPGWEGAKNLLLALFVSYSVESFQLYQADWIMAIRANKWGGLLLGHGFLWSDILLYTLGNMTGFWLGLVCDFKHRKSPH